MNLITTKMFIEWNEGLRIITQKYYLTPIYN